MAAEAELGPFKAIRKHLTTNRSRIRRYGDRFLVPLERIPGRLLEVGKQRIGVLKQQNRKRSHHYTDRTKGQVYRCPVPGCGGSVINLSCAGCAIPEHCNAFHRTLWVNLTYKIELGKYRTRNLMIEVA